MSNMYPAVLVVLENNYSSSLVAIAVRMLRSAGVLTEVVKANKNTKPNDISVEIVSKCSLDEFLAKNGNIQAVILTSDTMSRNTAKMLSGVLQSATFIVPKHYSDNGDKSIYYRLDIDPATWITYFEDLGVRIMQG